MVIRVLIIRLTRLLVLRKSGGALEAYIANASKRRRARRSGRGGQISLEPSPANPEATTRDWILSVGKILEGP